MERQEDSDVGIIGSILGKNDPVVEYRTIDGGHPAPYPDMTDEQLYNYEMTFKVARRTFDKPPRAHRANHARRVAPEEPFLHVEPLPRAQPVPTSDLPSWQQRSRQKAFDAPRYTRKKPGPVGQEQANSEIAGKAPAIDFSKPVRLVTSKQPVEIMTTRARHPIYKVHAYVGNDDVVTVFTLDGRLCENGPCFLENVPQQQELHLNIYPHPDPHGPEQFLVTQHATRNDADAAARAGRLACASVQFDVQPGG